jgi:hypothetical protein
VRRCDILGHATIYLRDGERNMQRRNLPDMTHMPRQPVDMGTLKGFPHPPAMVRHAQRWHSWRAPHATRQWARSLARMLVLGLVACANSCVSGGVCVEGLDIGTTYQVTVLEPADANSQYGVQTSNGQDFGMNVVGLPTCGAGFDFVASSTFFIQPVALQRFVAQCEGRIAIPSGVTEIQLGGQTGGVMHGADLMATPPFEADRGGGCVGQWDLGFISTHHDPPLNAPVPGEYPPVLLLRTFQPDAAVDLQSCLLPDSKLATFGAGYCADYFVVKLEKT